MKQCYCCKGHAAIKIHGRNICNNCLRIFYNAVSVLEESKCTK